MTGFNNAFNPLNVDRPQDFGVARQGAARYPLSGSSGSFSGAPVAVGVAGTLSEAHTFTTASNAVEELYLYASNFSGGNLNLTLSFATSSAGAFGSDNSIIVPINSQAGLSLVLPGVPMRSNNIENPLKCYVCTSAANSLNIVGYVHRFYSKEPPVGGAINNDVGYYFGDED
jgi:hypothetical protein